MNLKHVAVVLSGLLSMLASAALVAAQQRPHSHGTHAAPPPAASPQPGGGHAGHDALGSTGGMSMHMMALDGMLAESRQHSEAALKTLDDLSSALRELELGQDRPAALARAKRALEATRRHIGHTHYLLGMSADAQMLENQARRAAPHLGAPHEGGPAPVRPGGRQRLPGGGARSSPGAARHERHRAPGR